jgi:hypothetical protein
VCERKRILPFYISRDGPYIMSLLERESRRRKSLSVVVVGPLSWSCK